MNDLININTNFDGEEFKRKFFEYLDVGSDCTIKTYYNGITDFLGYINNKSIKMPNRQTIVDWKNDLKERTSPSTTNTWLVGVKRFFKFLSVYGLYPNVSDDVKGFKLSKLPKKNVLTKQQVQEIYSTLTNNKRDKALFGLLITTGLRGIEVANAKIEDLVLTNNKHCLFIKCKGHSEKDEFVKIPENVFEDLKNYIGDRKEGYIFISESNHNKGKGMTTKSIRYIIKSIFQANGIDDETISLHSTRRTFSCIAYETGASIFDIQQVLHHASIQTTTRYLQMVDRFNNRTEEKVGAILC